MAPECRPDTEVESESDGDDEEDPADAVLDRLAALGGVEAAVVVASTAARPHALRVEVRRVLPREDLRVVLVACTTSGVLVVCVLVLDQCCTRRDPIRERAVQR